MTFGMPKFSSPPVVETLLAVQFEPLAQMRVTDYGLFWNLISDEFPVVQEHPPIPAIIESVEAQPMVINPMQWRIGGEFPPPRVWYRSSPENINEAGEHGIQIQKDRFMQNWMRPGHNSGRYPSYESNRADFVKYLTLFKNFLAENKLGELVPNQCEVTYVNRIAVPSERGALHAAYAECFPGLTTGHSTDFLPGSERVMSLASFPIQKDRGWLHIQIHGPVRLATGAAAIDFRLTARGAPLKAASDPVMEWLDLGREWVVRGFHCLTSATMHQKWGYQNG